MIRAFRVMVCWRCEVACSAQLLLLSISMRTTMKMSLGLCCAVLTHLTSSFCIWDHVKNWEFYNAPVLKKYNVIYTFGYLSERLFVFECRTTCTAPQRLETAVMMKKQSVWQAASAVQKDRWDDNTLSASLKEHSARLNQPGRFPRGWDTETNWDSIFTCELSTHSAKTSADCTL